MSGPACSTSMDGRQPADGETLDQARVTCRGKQWFMTEYKAGSFQYFKAYVSAETQELVKLKFPGTAGLGWDLNDFVKLAASPATSKRHLRCVMTAHLKSPSVVCSLQGDW